MTDWLALLRGINLGKRRVKMDDLREHFAALKFAGVETFIASGNVSFSARAADEAVLRTRIERHLHAALGYEVDTFLRTRAELATVAIARPFAAADMADETFTVSVGFLHEPLAPDTTRRLLALGNDYDEFAVIGREYFWLTRGKTTDSKVYGTPAWRAVKWPTSTVRNLTTVRKMAALYPPRAA